MNNQMIKKYNELIKIAVETISVWKKGSYQNKAKEIESCKRDIVFFKSMKTKLTK